MVGQFVRQKTRISFKGRNPTDKPGADVLSDLFLFIRQNNDLEYEEKEQAEDGFTGGMGVLKACVTYDDAFQPNIELKQVDSFTIFPDPYSRRYDWNQDANYINEAIWIDRDDLLQMYPGKKTEIAAAYDSNAQMGQLSESDRIRREQWIDADRERIRLIEQWYKKKTFESVCVFQDGSIYRKEENTLASPDGQIIEEKLSKSRVKELKSAQPYEEYDRIIHSLCMGLFIKGCLLEHKVTDRKFFPYIPYFVSRKKSGEPYSLIFIALEMQDALNKRESKALHLLSTNKRIYEQGAVTDKVAQAIEIARPDGQEEVNKGFFERYREFSNMDLAAGQMQMFGSAMDSIRRITGINPDALGEKSEVRSGVGIARKQAMTDVIIAPVFDNFRRSRVIQARVVLELIQQHYTQPKIFYITDNLNATKAVNLDAGSLQAIKQAQYDIVVDEAPDATTRREETLQALGQVLPAILPFGPVWGEIMFDLVDIPDKEEIKKKVQAASQPPPQEPKISVTAQLDAMTPPERAAMWMKMGMPQIAQAVMQLQPQPADQVKAQGDMQKEQMKAQGTQMKAQADMAKTHMDVQAKAFDVQAKQQITQMEIEKKQAELAMEFQKLQMQVEAAHAMPERNGDARQWTLILLVATHTCRKKRRVIVAR